MVSLVLLLALLVRLVLLVLLVLLMHPDASVWGDCRELRFAGSELDWTGVTLGVCPSGRAGVPRARDKIFSH